MEADVLAAPDVGADAPECGADEETNILSELEERALEAKFVNHRI